MGPKNYLGAAMLVAVVGMGAMHATAQIPQSPGLPVATGAPPTLFKFLGLQKLRIARDSMINHKGKFPSLERKPPILRIADPKNLESKNPAIKKAAEIKTEEDMAPQKIKAISYLARMGCGCYEGVAEALIAALEDCTEEVRYAAAKALRDAAGEKCGTCNGSCCSEKVTDALYKRAYEKDDKCCWVEPSSRVRDMARQALCACSVPGLPETVPTSVPVRIEGEGPKTKEDAPPANSVTPPPPAAANRLPKAPAVLAAPEPPAAETQYVEQDVVEHSPAVTAKQPKQTAAQEVVTADMDEDFDPPPALPASLVKAVERQAKLAAQQPVRQAPLAPVFEEAAVEEPVTEQVEQPAPVVEAEAPAVARDEEGLTAEEREEVDAALKLFQPTNEEEEVGAEEASVPAEPVRKEAAKTETKQSAAKPEPKQSAQQPKKPANQGQVAMIHPNGSIQLQFDGQAPTIGSQIKVTHQGLIRTVTIGELQVVGVRGQFVYARPVGKLTANQVSKGDQVQVTKLAPAPTAAPVAIARVEQAVEAPVERTVEKPVTTRRAQPAPAAEVAIADERPAPRQAPLPPAPKTRDVIPVKHQPERMGPAIWGVDE